MKVAIFIRNHLGEAGGGFTFEENVFTSLIELAPMAAHQFVVFGWEEDAPKAIANSKISYVSLRQDFLTRLGVYIDRRLGNQSESYFDKVLLEHQIDFVVSLSSGAPETDFPFVTVVWDLQHRLQPYFPEVSSEGQWQIREGSYGRILRRASAIIVGTEVGRNEVADFFQIPAERIWKLPHPTPRFALESKHEIGAANFLKNISSDYLFYPAQFWPHKNHINLLHALRILHDEHRLECDLVLVGSDKGNREHVLKTVQDLKLTTKVHMLGFVSREELVGLYQNAFAMTYASFCGPENLPPLEAFALGCPVIAGNVAGAEEQLGDAAILVNPADPYEIAGAVRRLKEESPLRKTLIERGSVRAKKWTSHDYVRGLFKILDHFEPIRRTWSNQNRYHQT